MQLRHFDLASKRMVVEEVKEQMQVIYLQEMDDLVNDAAVTAVFALSDSSLRGEKWQSNSTAKFGGGGDGGTAGKGVGGNGFAGGGGSLVSTTSRPPGATDGRPGAGGGGPSLRVGRVFILI